MQNDDKLLESAGVLVPPPLEGSDSTGESVTDAASRTDAEIAVSDDPAADAPDLPAPDPSPEVLTHSEMDVADVLIADLGEQPQTDAQADEAQTLAVLESIVYITDEPLSAKQIADGLGRPLDEVKKLLDKLVDEYNRPHHGLSVKEVAGGYKMATKPENHEAVRAFVKSLNPPLKLSLAALETLAVIAYKQPITAPEVMEVRGVQGAGVLKTLLDRKLITSAGRKNVIGKPILYKTTKEFLVQFGLKDLNELPSLKEFEDLRRLAFIDVEETPSSNEPGERAEPAQP